MRFAVLAFALLAAVLLAVIHGKRRRRQLLSRIIGNTQRMREMTDVSRRKWHIRNGLLIAGVVLALLALARPWWGRRLIPAEDRARDVIVAFDCSRSMLAQDVAPIPTGTCKMADSYAH